VRALMLLAVLGALMMRPAVAGGPLVLDDALLTALARTREPEVRFAYLDDEDRIEIRTRRSALVAWVDVLLVAHFERVGKRVQLVPLSLRAGPIVQRGKRFEDARGGLRKLVDVETTATRVEVYKAGQLVYSQELD
jgi:hypothetical protein